MKLSTRFYIYKKLAIGLCLVFLLQIGLPTVSYALTSGPSRPEVQSFEPITTTEMVDLFSGDFNYNIPLLEVPGPNGGYPINLLYNAGINMDQEASWVGLGWNLNPGAIVRSVQGLPDEYNGATTANVRNDYDMKPSVSISAGAGLGGLEIVGGDLLNASFGLDVTYNNYKGFNTAFRGGLSLGREITNDNSGKMLGTIDLGLSLDNETGLGASLSAGVKQGVDQNNYSSYYVGVGYNQASGLSNISFGSTSAANTSKDVLVSSDKYKVVYKSVAVKGSGMGQATLSLNSPGNLPRTERQLETRFGSVNVKIGFEAAALFSSLGIHGSISSSYISNKNITKNYSGFGYMNADKSTQNGDMLDFTREQDGMINVKTPNLPIPVASPDIFSMTSHGASTMFRAFRNDVGVYRDREDVGTIQGGVAGLEILLHFGGHGAYTYGENYTGKWKTNNNADAHFGFKSAVPNSDNEAWYFKSYGELTATPKNKFNNINNNKPVRLQVVDDEFNDNLNPALEDIDGQLLTSTPSNQFNTTGREKRNTAIQYIDADDTKKGIYSITPDGSTYIYGKAQLINKNVECLFSIDGDNRKITDTKISNFPIKNNSTPDYDVKTGMSDKFYDKKTLTDPYPYTYLITEIKGVDYIDVNYNGIADDGDKGYWVKFSYVDVATASTPYKFKNPFSGANYLRGKNTGPQDDKAQYVYGEKTISYLCSLETNSHKAIFDLSDRADGFGANTEVNVSSASLFGSVALKKIDYIRLYSKKDPTTPLLKVVFDYSYELCRNVENNNKAAFPNYLNKSTNSNVMNEGGKLTLKKVWIEYEKSKRGRMNAYQFDYDQGNLLSNPNYAVNSYDRWGGYYNRKLDINRPTFTESGTPCDIPYLPQDPTKRAMLDQYAAAWSLRGIKLPSGSNISVTYEADDYAYVQNKRAMQMVPISHIGDAAGNGNIDPDLANHRKIYFKLETPILKSRTDAVAYFQKSYIGDMTQVYFRNYTSMVADARMDYVGGYAPISNSGLYDSNGSSIYYDQGYIKLGDITIGVKTFQHHPFCLATWQTIMTNYPELLYTGKVDADPNSNKSTKIAQVKNLFSHFGRLMSVFTGFYGYAKTKNWGTSLDLTRSYIRLQTPDYSKVGGGVRVKKIVLSDKWDQMQTGAVASVYGQYYDYTTVVDGQSVSSGVATYEPMIGADENPYKTVKKYSNCVPLKLTKQLCFEENVNESYFPAASVGYSKVTVKSLATYNNENRAQSGEVPNGIMTNGATINEFYTCKEFPVIVGETKINVNHEKMWIPIPTIGTYLAMKLFASQGYSVELNDMHGKVKKISTFEQKNDGSIDYQKPLTFVKYDYFADKTSTASGNDTYVLNSDVPVLIKNSFGDIVKSSKYKLGEQIEFFTDMREEHANETSGGATFNSDGIIIPPIPAIIFLPSVWPSFEHSENKTRAAVTNKVVHRFGVLKSVTAYNSGSTVTTTNLVFDGQTGIAVLTSVNNNFNDPIYKYDVPANLIYDGMNVASKSIGINFNLMNIGMNSKTGEVKCLSSFSNINNNAELFKLLKQGDVIKYYESPTGPTHFATISKIEGSFVYVQGDVLFLNNSYLRCVLIKPGRENLITTNVGSVTTLGSSGTGYNVNPIDQLYTTE